MSAGLLGSSEESCVDKKIDMEDFYSRWVWYESLVVRWQWGASRDSDKFLVGVSRPEATSSLQVGYVFPFEVF